MIRGNVIKLLRTWKELTQEEVAEKLGISQPAYSKIEKCKYVKERKLEKILQAMNCTHKDLVTFKGSSVR